MPPVTFSVTSPLLAPQVAGEGVAVAEGPFVFVTVALAVVEQLFASVTVTV